MSAVAGRNLSIVRISAFWKDSEGFSVDRILWITEVVWILAWLMPIHLILGASLPISPRLARKSGMCQMRGGGSIMFFVLIFDGWWSMRMGSFVGGPILVGQMALLQAAFLVLYGAYDVLSGIREQNGPISVSLSPYLIGITLPVELLLAGIVVASAANGKVPTDKYIEITVLGVNAGLLFSLYVLGGLLARLVRPNGKTYRLAYAGSILILLCGALRVYFLIRPASHSALWLQYIAAAGVLLAVLFHYSTAGPALRELIHRSRNGQRETPFELRKVETRKRSAIAVSIMVLFIVAAGILMLESVRSDEQMIEATYLAQQQKIAKSMAVNVGSLTSDLIHELKTVSEMHGVRRGQMPGMRPDFFRAPS